MLAVDSLRQLAMKFLARDELANYQFQNDFLKPFVVVMRQSPNVEIRELIIRCVSQMVLARVSNIKSGWKSMFMVRAIRPYPTPHARASSCALDSAPIRRNVSLPRQFSARCPPPLIGEHS